MSVFINAYRQVLLGGSMPNWGSLFIGAAISIFLFTTSYVLFKRLEGTFADVA
jgi:ABC-type polysaccharide/polyol phosphate export permease